MTDKFFSGFIAFLNNLNGITTYKFLAYMIIVIFMWFIRNIILRLCK